MLLNHDKGQGTVILDKTKSIEKCMNLINTDHFRELEQYPTEGTETKLQNLLRSLKKKKKIKEKKKRKKYI